MTHYLALRDANDAIINGVRTAKSLASVTMFDVLCIISYGDLFPSLSLSSFFRADRSRDILKSDGKQNSLTEVDGCFQFSNFPSFSRFPTSLKHRREKIETYGPTGDVAATRCRRSSRSGRPSSPTPSAGPAAAPAVNPRP